MPSLPPGDPPVDPEATFELLHRANAGDDQALNALFARYLKPLQRWATGRLPGYARSAADTHDLVQDTLLNAFRKIGTFEPRREGAFQAYLRQAVMNRIRDEIRRSKVRPVATTFDELEHEHEGSPHQDLISLEVFESYEAALSRLTEGEREAIIGRVELGQSYADLALALGKPSPDAARLAVTRALVRLAEEMARDESAS